MSGAMEVDTQSPTTAEDVKPSTVQQETSSSTEEKPSTSDQMTVDVPAEDNKAESSSAAAAKQEPRAANGDDVDGTAVQQNGDHAESTTDGEEANGAQAAKAEPAETLPEDATETLYIQNLNETVRIENLQQTLQNLFKPYRPIPPVVAHHNVRMRGQAFVSFADKETANKARKEVQSFPLYGKPMKLSFARSRSDSVVEKLEGEEALDSHKKRRLEHKKKTRRNNPLREKAKAKYKAAKASAAAAGTEAPAAGAAQRKTQLQVPDEYLPPNKVLFIQNLPDGTSKEDLQDVFEQHPNLLEIRLVPTRKDIAFVEYTDEPSAIAAKEALHNFKIDGETKMKVTYAKK